MDQKPGRAPIPSHPFRWFPEFWELGRKRLRPQARLLALALLVGVIAGLGAVVFNSACQVVTHYALDGIAGYRPSAPGGEPEVMQKTETPFTPWLLLLVPVAGGILSGFLVYTLAPEASVTEIVAETRAALDWLAANGAVHGIAGPLVISGWSAGAHLAALALNHPAVTAGMVISGVYDLAPIRDTNLNDALSLTEEEVVELSPLRLAVVHKPLIIAYGERELDRLVEDSQDFHALRAAAQAPGRLLPIAGADHFSILKRLRRKDGALVQALLRQGVAGQ